MVAHVRTDIDSAWLWPYAETLRKCARSWASQIHYMSMYPTYVFAASQAQQYAWMKEHYPALWTSIKKAVASGRFVPTGGTWIEMVPSWKESRSPYLTLLSS